eukprot:TRINITY_DN7134_c0_g1_i1.p1 TRINITY_DN7134_c0_g1~~TRINITY_DN7134_c0_g1_i1.p1  ORF type:complete len:385 (+),score=125.10 TRINITY_DN7134_c0_g1_i1:54-1157(+)
MLCRGLGSASRAARFVVQMGQQQQQQQRAYAAGLSAFEYKYSSHGQPADVLKLESTPVPAIKDNQVLVKMLASPINPADINMIQGVYPIKPTLPAVAGNEGVARVMEVGSQVKGLKVDDMVIPANAGFGTWRSHAVAGEADLVKVPSTIDTPEQAACLSVNPCTAYRLLNDFASLQAGDVIVQNGANSAVGQSVFQMARDRGVKTINIIRQNPEQDRLVERMKTNGADIVVTEDYVRTPAFRRLIADLPAPKLAFNGVGGVSATEMARLLTKGGTMVTYGGMSRKPIQIPTSLFIFKDIQLKGFWMTEWNNKASQADRQTMIDDVAGMMSGGKLRLWVETYKFTDFQKALERSQEPYKSRKVVVVHD